MQDGKLVISGKNISSNTTATVLNIGDIVKAINGKQYKDFTSECDYLLWTYQYKESSFSVEKIDGEIVIIKKSSLL
jgi:PDZ domain-containing secreted protein